MKRVMVACGTGGVTSKNIAMKIEKFLKEHKIEAKIDTCKVVEIPDKIRIFKPDLVLAATRLPKLDCPTISSTVLLTGVGLDNIYTEILEVLQKIEER